MFAAFNNTNENDYALARISFPDQCSICNQNLFFSDESVEYRATLFTIHFHSNLIICSGFHQLSFVVHREHLTTTDFI